MHRNAVLHTPLWSTSSYSDTVDTSPMELSALGKHLALCNDAHGRFFTLRCLVETAHGFMAQRLVTTLVAAALVIGVASVLA